MLGFGFVPTLSKAWQVHVCWQALTASFYKWPRSCRWYRSCIYAMTTTLSSWLVVKIMSRSCLRTSATCGGEQSPTRKALTSFGQTACLLCCAVLSVSGLRLYAAVAPAHPCCPSHLLYTCTNTSTLDWQCCHGVCRCDVLV